MTTPDGHGQRETQMHDAPVASRGTADKGQHNGYRRPCALAHVCVFVTLTVSLLLAHALPHKAWSNIQTPAQEASANVQTRAASPPTDLHAGTPDTPSASASYAEAKPATTDRKRRHPAIAPDSAYPNGIPETPVEAIVLRIADGDTIIVDIPGYPPIIGHRIAVRVAGCDTPESNDPRQEMRTLARRATFRTREMAPPGCTVRLHNLKRDKYFRLLADVETPVGDLGTHLIGEGLARPYSGGRKTW